MINLIPEAVQQFCQQHGLSNVTIEEGGALTLTIDQIGELQFVHKPPHFLIGLSRRVENLYLLNARKVLAQAHFRAEHLKPLHTRLHEDNLGIYYIFQEREIEAAMLSKGLDSLTEVMDQIFQSL